MKYRIGEISKLMGLSIEGIRKYERAGIITPQRTSCSQYRMYNYLDITSMIRSRAYRSLGFSLKEIETLINGAELEDAVRQLRAKCESLSQDRLILEMKQELLRSQLSDLETVKQRLGCIQIVQAPSFFRMEFGKNGAVYKDDSHVALFREWMEYIPFAHISTRFHGKDAYGGLAISESFAQRMGISKAEHVVYIPEQTCMQVILSETGNEYADADTLEEMKEFAQEHRFTMTDDVYGHSVISLHKSSVYQRYRKVWSQIGY